MDPLEHLTPQDFLPIKALGHGDIGSVFLVELGKNKKRYAMKVIHKEVLRRKGEKRAATEKKVLLSVSHPLLPTLHAHFQSENHVFFLMDFCSGGDLNVLRQKQPSKMFSGSVTRFYAAEVVIALEYLHSQGIIYRDLKPENILIQSNGHIMLSDFDLSLIVEKKDITVPPQKHKRSFAAIFSCFAPNSQTIQDIQEEQQEENNRNGQTMDSVLRQQVEKAEKSSFPFYKWSRKAAKAEEDEGCSSLCHSYSFVGTEEYVAPEVLWAKGHGFSVDWWTLGILIYEMVYGKTPFKGPNRKETFYNILCKEPEFNSHCPMNDLIRKLLVKDPRLRLGSLHGSKEIKSHPYFKGTSWKHMQRVTTRPPFVPPVDIDVDELLVNDEHSPSSRGNQLLFYVDETATKGKCKKAYTSSSDGKENFRNITNSLNHNTNKNSENSKPFMALLNGNNGCGKEQIANIQQKDRMFQKKELRTRTETQ